MNDYKELIDELRHYFYDTELVLDAADAIEQLVMDKERDDKIIASLQKELVEAANARDAAVKEISIYHYCRSCKHSDVSEEKEPCISCNQCWAGREKCNWEWRGVKEEAEKALAKRKDDIVDLCTTGYLHLGYVEEKGGDE